MRGKPAGGVESVATAGITPAGAGKTSGSSPRTSNDRDHPRRCGENRQVLSGAGLRRGSPPQVRGKRSHSWISSLLPGITPAGAGKTAPVADPRRSGRDHPRRCGENLPSISTVPDLAGSPPQVRGKLRLTVPSGARLRITPAGAGKTVF